MNPTIRRAYPRSSLEGPAYPAGTEVVLLEALGDGRAWLAEVRVPDDSLVGGAAYDCIEVALADLVLDDEASRDIAEAEPAVDSERPLARDVDVPDKSSKFAREESVAA